MGNNKLDCFGALLIVPAMTLSISAFAASAEQTLRLDSRDLNSIKIFAGEGQLEIQGGDGETIEVVAKIVGGRDSRRFTLVKDGDAAVVVAINTERHFVWFGERPRIDVTVKVPSRLLLEVRDGPGEIKIAGMQAAAIVSDDSGALYVNDHHGNLSIYDGEGAVELNNITGNIYVQDGHGHLSVKNVTGDVDINDGIGSIVVNTIDGRVNIHDGRGGIAAANVTQGVTINDDRTRLLAKALTKNGDPHP